MKQQESFIILSAERTEYGADVNRERSDMLARQLQARDLDFAPVTGCYKGAQERAFLVLAGEDSPDWYAVLSLARRYGQESILSVCGSRLASLHYLADAENPVRLGEFRPVPAAYALGLDAWTRDAAGNYWSACP